jgi:hypothetical protein
MAESYLNYVWKFKLKEDLIRLLYKDQSAKAVCGNNG